MTQFHILLLAVVRGVVRTGVIIMTCVTAVTALAQESEVAPRPGIEWTGFYVGGHAGAGTTEFDSAFDTSEIVFGPLDVLDSVLGRFFDLDGGLSGVQIGFNRSHGRLVYGVEADWSHLGISDRLFDPDFEFGGTDNASVDINWLASVRGRLGVSSAQTLFYATAGPAWVDADYTAVDADNGPPDQGSTELNSVGLVVGGGIEHALTNRFTIRMEGLYYHFDNLVDTRALNADSDPGDFAKLESILVARLGLNYMLTRPGVAGQKTATRSYGPADWRGVYAGGNIGYGVVDFESIFDASEIFTPINTEDSVIGSNFDLDGVLGGVHAGVNRQRGRTVFGVEADWNYLGTSDLLFDPDGGVGGDDSASIDVNWIASLRGRLGITSARTLLYATAGVAWVTGDYTARNGNFGFENTGSTDVNATGVVVGGGIEHAVNDNLFIRFEGLRHIFNDQKDTRSLTTDSDPGDFAGFDDITVVRVGLTRKLGGRRN